MVTKIRVWNRAITSSDVPLGISREEAERRALNLLEALSRGGGVSVPLCFSEDLPDVLHALVQVMVRSQSNSEGQYKALRDLHRFVSGLDWPLDEFAEKAQLLAHISQLAWSRCLDRGGAVEIRQWEDECLKYFLLQEGVQQVAEMPAASWTPAVCERFLSDRAFLLALCGWMESRWDSSPRPVFELALVAYEWMSTHYCSDAVSVEDAYLLGRLAFALASTLRALGQYRKSGEWLRVATKWSKGSGNSESLQARIEYGRLAGLADVHRYSYVLAQVPRLIQRFERLGLEDDAAKAVFLQAVAQKELGSDEQAIASFSALKTEPAVLRRPWFKAIVLISLADLQNRAGDLGTSLCSIKEAEVLLQGARVPFAQAHCCGVTAEILRDHGKHIAAVEYYRRAVEIYLGVEMAGFAAYHRLLLAETLLATGAADEAVDEILAALPVIEREQLVREGIAAVGLLKASMAGRRLDSDALKTLRESLERSRQEAEP